ncbi:MAG: outer rane efflux protein [Gammaproteobacteria bacterium]|nr:outer rane efflux protein [Gammaproteobacteria bacterium]
MLAFMQSWGFKSELSVNNLIFNVFILIILSGCDAVGPEFVQPDAPVSQQWLEGDDPKISATQAEFSEWWTIFNDPVLNTLVENAYQQNLPLQIAGIRILEARAQLGIAVGNAYPQLQQARGGISHIELSENQSNFSPALDTSFRDVNVGFDMGWELDLWGRFRRGIEAADADLLASIADYDDVLVSLTANVATAYTLIRTFEERLAIARANVEIQEESLEIAETRFSGGLTTELDVQQARTLLLNTRATIPALEIGLQQSKHALSTLLGMPPGDLEDALGSLGVIPTAPAAVAIGIPAELLRRRPDIRRAELQAAAQSARIGIAEGDLYPHFSLVGSIGLRASDTFETDLGDLFQLNSIEAFGGPSLTWDVFNYGRIKNNVRVQDARLQQLIVNYQNTVLEASREVEDALVAFLRAQEQVGFLAESVDAANRSVDLAILQYSNGIADYQRVLDTQEALVNQQDLLTSRRGDIATNLIAMFRALGGGWEIRAGKALVPEKTKETMRNRSDWGQLLKPATPDTNESDENKGLFRRPDW